MSVITIQCRLVAEEDTLRQLWELMVEKNTPLINELLAQVGKHPEFETWLEKGKIPTEFLKTLVNSLKTQEVVEEKVTKITETLTKAKHKDDLNDQQQAFITRQQSTLDRINNPFPRPSKPIYKGQSSILVGISFGLEKPVTVAVVDVVKNEVLAYHSVKQLLGKNYSLLNRQRQQQQRLSHERHKAQKQNAPNDFGESELGQYVDRLLADGIVAIAKTYQACSIVLPKLGDMREQISSEIQSRAEKKCPGYKEAQQKYAKEYRKSIHRWSYGRLIENIQSQAAKAGISTEIGTQPIRGSPQEKARDLAVFAYQERQAALI
ncbi:hypothetical protein H6G08_34590 [Calothrix anomala FACHB-343]|uniref:Uncharacterized protein n=2 Tax=Calothrix TaxID=1186 RepID=A0ABR8AMX0_9CYAN|nr:MULTISPECIES: type V CRISPR-associated protein Cas12k [Calothrix]MBD2200895.1 hypothetical protein [Calothrix parietina FACHB-288]MBD2229535.1 hypothetical protein [Calothrix anomala FACHB-343]